jgi:mitochondrial fission protein ELM1
MRSAMWPEAPIPVSLRQSQTAPSPPAPLRAMSWRDRMDAMTNNPGSRDVPNNTASPRVFVVDSAYTGELNARLGVARRLGLSYRIVPLPEGEISAYADGLMPEAARGQSASMEQRCILVSGTGEDTVSEIADLRHLFGPRLLTVYLASILPSVVNPRLAEYDLVASPQISGTNVVTTLGVPHPLTRELLRQESEAHRERFRALSRPLIGLLLGGNTWYCSGFDAEHGGRLASQVSRIAEAIGGRVIVSNSRRTPDAALKSVLGTLGDRCCLFSDWQQSPPGFYAALLASCDLLIVSGDSLSMCSEATYTGKPVLIDLPEAATEIQHRQIVGRLFASGVARPLTDCFEPWSYVPPDPTGEVVGAIQRRLHRAAIH